jgi:hypothetical protein
MKRSVRRHERAARLADPYGTLHDGPTGICGDEIVSHSGSKRSTLNARHQPSYGALSTRCCVAVGCGRPTSPAPTTYTGSSTPR